MPLHVENLYNEYQSAAAFAVASLLLLVAMATLVARRLIEHRATQPDPVEDSLPVAQRVDLASVPGGIAP
jgi:sulfate transport system permease protein